MSYFFKMKIVKFEKSIVFQFLEISKRLYGCSIDFCMPKMPIRINFKKDMGIIAWEENTNNLDGSKNYLTFNSENLDNIKDNIFCLDFNDNDERDKYFELFSDHLNKIRKDFDDNEYEF